MILYSNLQISATWPSFLKHKSNKHMNDNSRSKNKQTQSDLKREREDLNKYKENSFSVSDLWSDINSTSLID